MGPSLRPRPVSRAIDAAKAAVVALRDGDRAWFRRWILRWVRKDGSLAIPPASSESHYVYPPRVDD
jgi:hypothetical protein